MSGLDNLNRDGLDLGAGDGEKAPQDFASESLETAYGALICVSDTAEVLSLLRASKARNKVQLCVQLDGRVYSLTFAKLAEVLAPFEVKPATLPRAVQREWQNT